MLRRLAIILCLLLLVIVIGSGVLLFSGDLPFGRSGSGAATASGYGQGGAIGGPFTLVAANGQNVTDQSFRGKWLLVYFGYTFCPDACPTTLSHVAEALQKLGPDAQKITPLFITVDPKRDTPKVMGTYVKAFDPRIVGLSGTSGEIAAVAKEYHVYYAIEKSNDPDSYLVDHSSFIYVMTPKGAFREAIPGTTDGPTLAATVKKLVDASS